MDTCMSSWWKTVWLYLVKLKMSMSHEAAILLRCISMREMCTERHEEMGDNILSSVLHNSLPLETFQMSIDSR